MQKNPELIIEAFEARRDAEAAARKKKTALRVLDFVRLILACIALVVFSEAKSTAMLFAVALFAYFSTETQKRWALEDRLEALEQKVP